jgi:hypothetical protein
MWLEKEMKRYVYPFGIIPRNLDFENICALNIPVNAGCFEEEK